MAYSIDRAAYASMFGPTTGDKLRLADTNLIIEVEDDKTIYGEEVKFSGGKVIRDGMGQSQATSAEGAFDTVITNDIYTREDAGFLTRADALVPERIAGIETGCCPHMVIGEDASMNLAVVADMSAKFQWLEVVFIESGDDNLSATFSPELADITIYVIDVSVGDKIPRKGGPGITRSDLLVINKTALAPLVGAGLEIMDRDSKKMRNDCPFVFAKVKHGDGVQAIIDFIVETGDLRPS